MTAQTNTVYEGYDSTGSVVEFNSEVAYIPRVVTRLDPQELRLLLIEDQMSDAILAEELLDNGMSDYRWEITHKPSIAKALSALHDMRFDMALVDLSLQDIEGVETISVLHMAAPYLPLVVYTGSGDHRLLNGALANGARFYIEKGKITPQSMRTIIRSALAKTI